MVAFRSSAATRSVDKADNFYGPLDKQGDHPYTDLKLMKGTQMKIDGRALRGAVNRYVKTHHSDLDPKFTVRTVVEWNRYGSGPLKIVTLEIRFDDGCNDAMVVWGGVADYILNAWWPDNKGEITTKVYETIWGTKVAKQVPVNKVTVITGFTH